MIIRTPNRERYVTISKVPLEDPRLSWKARGLHAYLISKPDGWKVIVAHLVAQGPDGKAAVMAGLKELEDYGYIVRRPRQKVKGRYDGIDCDVLEEPVEKISKSPGGTVSDIHTPHRVRFSDAENQPVVNYEVLNDDLVKDESALRDFSADELARKKALKEIRTGFGSLISNS